MGAHADWLRGVMDDTKGGDVMIMILASEAANRYCPIAHIESGWKNCAADRCMAWEKATHPEDREQGLGGCRLIYPQSGERK